MPRFVLLFHECPPDYERPSHWDFMLETGGALRTWVLSELPSAWRVAYEKTASTQLVCPPTAAGDVVGAQELGDHRLAYLDFEGPLTGDRGRVVRIDAGTYRTLDNAADAPNCLQFELFGGLLRGALRLTQSEAKGQRWTLSVAPTA